MDEELLVHWKIRYKNVYSASLGGQDYYFRSLTLEEIENIDLMVNAEGSSADLEDLYVRTAVLYPLDINWAEIKAGYITTLAEEIKGYSGLGDITDIVISLNQSREFLNLDIFGSMKAFILSALPQYTEEDLSGFTIQDLIHKVVMAERILTIQQSINGVQSEGVQFQIFLEEPEQEKKKQGKPAIDREELLRRIRKDDREMADVQKLMEVDHGQLENFDEDLLIKAAGVIKPEDPIARKLREALGG